MRPTTHTAKEWSSLHSFDDELLEFNMGFLVFRQDFAICQRLLERSE